MNDRCTRGATRRLGNGPDAEPAGRTGLRRRAWIGLGANLGDAPAALTAALAGLAAITGVRVLAVSGLYRSAPVDASGPDFHNAVARLSTTLAPEALLDSLQALEAAAGRQRPFPNAPRTLDLDLLLMDGVIHAEPRLTLPHPRLHQRAFVLHPLLEIDPDIVLPGWGPARDLLPAVADQAVRRLSQPPAGWRPGAPDTLEARA